MHEYENIQFDDIAQILQQAHLRRSADLGLWLRQYFREISPNRRSETNLARVR
jgi:hypothetical protein